LGGCQYDAVVLVANHEVPWDIVNVSIASLVVSMVAVLAATASAFFARGQVREMRRQVREMRRQFDESGPRVKLEDLSAGFRAGNPDVGVPVMLSLSNQGRGTARVKSLVLTMFKGEHLTSGAILALREHEARPKPPFDLAGLDSARWTIAWDWLCQQAAERGFDLIEPSVLLGDGTKVTCPPILVPTSR
jgi:hypothetical protein